MTLAHQANDDGNHQASLPIMNADGSSAVSVSLGSTDGVVREKRQIYGRYYVSTRYIIILNLNSIIKEWYLNITH